MVVSPKTLKKVPPHPAGAAVLLFSCASSKRLEGGPAWLPAPAWPGTQACVLPPAGLPKDDAAPEHVVKDGEDLFGTDGATTVSALPCAGPMIPLYFPYICPYILPIKYG
jgi:hypothetical protein